MAIADGEVVARVLGGDVEAYALLFQKYGRMVHALALARTTRRDAASRLVRTTFEKAYGSLDAIPAESTFRQHLLSILQQEASAHQRDHGRSLQMLRVGSLEKRKAGASLELSWVLSGLKGEEAALVLLEAASRLPANYEAPLLLLYLEGMSHPEIAEATGLPPSEVRTALDGGRRLFERELRHAFESAG